MVCMPDSPLTLLHLSLSHTSYSLTPLTLSLLSLSYTMDTLLDRWHTTFGSEVPEAVSYTHLVAEMKRLYVKPAHRGRHLGRILAERIIAVAKESGFDKIILDTMVEMKAAQQLYDQLGFTMMPPYDHQDPERIVCYEKQLQAK